MRRLRPAIGALALGVGRHRQLPAQAGPQGFRDTPDGSEDADARTPSGRKILVGIAITVGILTVLLGLAAIVMVWKRPQAKAEPREKPPACIRLECSGCKRNLKVKPELAGKQVKCPCGVLVQVPATGS